jgi:hypothetical protein
MSEMARWQEQEDGSEERFHHNNFSSRIGKEKRVRKTSLYTSRGKVKALG